MVLSYSNLVSLVAKAIAQSLRHQKPLAGIVKNEKGHHLLVQLYLGVQEDILEQMEVRAALELLLDIGTS